jgi:hypothetical protein
LGNFELQFSKDEGNVTDDKVPYYYGFFHFVFAMGSMYFAMLFYWVESASNYAHVGVLLGYPYLVRRCYDVLSLSWAP